MNLVVSFIVGLFVFYWWSCYETHRGKIESYATMEQKILKVQEKLLASLEAHVRQFSGKSPSGVNQMVYNFLLVVNAVLNVATSMAVYLFLFFFYPFYSLQVVAMDVRENVVPYLYQ